MTAAPMDVVTAPVPAAGAVAPTGAEGTVDPLLFALLVDQALAGRAEVDPDVVEGTEPADGEGTEEGGEAEAATEVPAWAGLAALVLTLAAASPDAEPGAATVDSATTGSAPRPAATSPLVAPAPAAGIDAAAQPGTPLPAGMSVEPPPQQASSDTSATPTDDAPAAARPADPAGVPVVTGGPATVATAATAQVGEAPTARSVATQVIPEITRLVSDGEGVHRVTLQLNPKALGEVRVVLTMRHGEVHVRIAGGEEARHALAASSAELTRALQHVGIDEHRLTLTELAPTAASRGTELNDHPQDRHHHSPGGNQPDPHGQNSHSWMGDARSATDGSSTSNPTDRGSGSDRVHEASHARAAGGVDLRM